MWVNGLGAATTAVVMVTIAATKFAHGAWIVVGGDEHYVTIILPEFVPARWWQHLLHIETALLIKGAMLFRRRLIVADVPYHLT